MSPHVMRLPERLRRVLAGLSHWLAWLNGDHAYANHLAHLRAAHPDSHPPSRAEFYRSETERRWNSVRRCC